MPGEHRGPTGILVGLWEDGSIGVNKADLDVLRAWCKEHERQVLIKLVSREDQNVQFYHANGGPGVGRNPSREPVMDEIGKGIKAAQAYQSQFQQQQYMVEQLQAELVRRNLPIFVALEVMKLPLFEPVGGAECDCRVAALKVLTEFLSKRE